MSTQPKQHNESKADLNSDGPTVDAAVSVSKDSLENLAHKVEIVGLVATVAANALILYRKFQKR